jgi:hypothetical protein
MHALARDTHLRRLPLGPTPAAPRLVRGPSLQAESWAQISVAFPFREYEVITKVSASKVSR